MNQRTTYDMLQTIYDRLIEFLLVFLLAFTPLAYGAVHPWPIAIFEISAAIMVFLWILKILPRGRIEFTVSPVFLLFLLPIVIAFLQFFVSQYTTYCILPTTYDILPTTICSWATKTELLKLISYALIFLVTLNTIKTRRQIVRVLSAIIIVGFFMSIFYLMRYFGAPAPAGFINPDHFSAYLGMIIPLSLGLLICVIASHATEGGGAKQSHAEFGPRPLLFFTIIVMGGALFFTMSRGGMFSFIAALLFIAFIVSTRRSMKNKGWIILAIAVFIILVIAWLGATPVVERILSVKAEIASRYFGGRLPIWQGTIGIIKDNPIFGTGLGTFNYIFPKYQPVGIVAKHYTYAHSDFLELLSEFGAAGFILFLACGLWSIAYLFKHFYRRHDPWVVGISLCVFGSLASIFIHSFTDFNLHIPANAVLLTVILALFVSILNTTHDTRHTTYDRRIINYPAAVLAVGLLVIYTVAVVRPAIAAYLAQHTTHSIRPTIDDRRNLELAIRLDPTNAEYHYKLGRLYGKSKAYNLQLAEYQSAVRLNPTTSQYHQSLAWAYGRLVDIQHTTYNRLHTTNEFEAAIELSPTYYYPYQTYAIWLFNHPTKENIEKGVEIYKKAAALNPKLADKALADYFKVEKSYALLKKILPDTPENHYTVMNLLITKGLWENNEADFKEDMRTASYKYPYYKAMFRYYESKGDVNKGLEVLRDYLKLDPNCADAHFYIADRLAYIKPRNWQEVFAHHEKALALAPKNTFYREWYARHLFYAKRYNDAIAQMEKVVAKDGWNIELQQLLSDWKKTSSLRQ